MARGVGYLCALILMGTVSVRTVFAAFGFGAPAPLNSNAASDSGFDIKPQVTTDGLGAWVAVWESTDYLGATIGFDRDSRRMGIHRLPRRDDRV